MAPRYTYRCGVCNIAITATPKEGEKWLSYHVVTYHPEEVKELMDKYGVMTKAIDEVAAVTAKLADKELVPLARFTQLILRDYKRKQEVPDDKPAPTD